MNKTIATLQVIVTNDEEFKQGGKTHKVPKSSAIFTADPPNYRLYLNPVEDVKSMESVGTPCDGETMLQTIMAHELGHFICLLTQDETHNPLYCLLFGQMNGEKKAWELAEKMFPAYDKILKETALKSHEKGQKAHEQAVNKVVKEVLTDLEKEGGH